ncbi:retroviral-like aspartic protease family protein [Sphingomonas sp. BGYR3]|uniref:retroviral-like aspartic protease family protein n=1 Tax=Sphingomonas sp. BGYR3 TaxID=2975483 RepID=UPI0021A94C07|nr:retroviral-like aspartic protease family protein [Sphingomonas sp. BGYR3]MDG5488001.1 retroviral-like aspartic protease family protein [Sphingomonas sp. BGYR3]
MTGWLFTLLAMIGGVGEDRPAQPMPAPPAATTPTGDAALTEAEVLAIGYQETRMTVPVEIAGIGPHAFMIDTGSQRTVIARQLAEQLRLTAGPVISLTAMSGTSRVPTVTIPSLRLTERSRSSAITAPALEAHHVGGMGLLGVDVLQGHRVVIDFDANQMQLMPSSRRTATRARSDEIVVEARNRAGQLILTEAFYGGHRVRVVVDTGSSVTIGNSALRAIVARRGGKTVPMSLLSVTGGQVTADYGYVDRLKLGAMSFTNLPMAFVDVPPFARLGLDKRPAIMLGMDAISKFRRIEVDFPNRQVVFRMPREVAAGPRGIADRSAI